MTLRKYKKLLMSCGIERNLAEKHRMAIARVRKEFPLLSAKCVNDYMDDYKAQAKSEILFCNGSIRERKKMLRKALRKVVIV